MTRLLAVLRSSLAVFVLGLALLCVPQVSHAQTYSAAMADCQADAATHVSGSCTDDGNWITLHYCDCCGCSTSRYDFDPGTKPVDCSSLGGQSIPSGTSYDYYAASGASCKSSCAISMVVNIGGDPSGGLVSGSYVYTGESCPVSSGSTNEAIQAASETYNPDGSKTFCDTVSGKCVTAQAGAAPPASASSSGDVHSTDSTASTTTGATTSTSTSTTDTTYTPDGSSGSGTGFSGTSTATTTTTTDNPASASSTSTKCTTGVCDVGNADGQIGGIYSGSASTPGQAYQAFVANVRSAPIFQAATSFFTINVSGTCPTWHLAGNPWWGASGLDFTLFCDPAMLNLLALAGLIVLATAAFSAFRIAVY